MRTRLRQFSTLLLVSALWWPAPAEGQTRERGPWWPHARWGPKDQAGASNWITPAKVLEAAELIETGKIYELGHPYDPGMPLFADRTYSITTVSWPTWGPFPEGDLQVVGMDEMIVGQLGQIGTQFDGPGHPGIRLRFDDGETHDVFYNGYTAEEMRGPYGLRKLGVEHVRPYFTRGVLVDVAGLKGVETLPHGYRVTVADIEQALGRQGITPDGIRPGDAVFINYGWSRLWDSPTEFLDQWPSIAGEVVQWLVERQVSLFGEDGVGSHVHGRLVTQHGIFMLEAMRFDELLADEVYEFLFVFTPLPLTGATGSPGRPIGIR